MIKTVGIGLIAIGIFQTGREIETRRERCVQELEGYLRLLQFLEQEVVCRQTILPIALGRYQPFASGLAAVFCQTLIAYLEDRQENLPVLWKECIKNTYQNIVFGRDEIRLMQRCGEAFSMPRREMIAPQTKMDQEYLTKLLDIRRSKLEKERYLMRSLSIVASIFAVIILI